MSDSQQNRYLTVLERRLKAALRARDLDEATALLDKLKQESTLSCITRGLELEVKLAADAIEEALVLARQLVIDFPTSARIHYLSGQAHYRAKNYTAAVADLNESDRLHEHWQNRRLIGKAYTQLGDFTHAEAELLALVNQHHVVHRDLAWLYERMNETVRALQHIDKVVAIRPQDQAAQTQQLRLKTKLLDATTLDHEVAALQALDETVPEDLLIAQVGSLLARGQGQQARQMVAQNLDQLSYEALTKLGWDCYHADAYDLVLSLFIKALPTHLADVKYLTTLETAAKKCHRVNDVIAQYQQLAESNKPFYGRVKRLQKLI